MPQSGSADTKPIRRVGLLDARVIGVLAVVLLHAAAAVAELSPVARLVPKPQQVELSDGRFVWREGIVVHVAREGGADAFAVSTLIEAAGVRGISAPVLRTGTPTGGGPRILAGNPATWPELAAALGRAGQGGSLPEGVGAYLLSITPQEIIVAGRFEAGVYYGLQTLIQLLPDRDGGAIPALRVRDWTGIERRGVSIDMYSGEVYRMAAFEETVRRLAHYKMNQLVMYLEDAFLFPSHPSIGEDRDRVTTEQVQALSAFARRHHVDIAPSYDTPAHMSRTLADPKYAHLAETEGGGVINVTHPETYPLLTDLFADLCKAFPSPYNYAALDEVFGLGGGASLETTQTLGQRALYLKHLRFVYETLKSCGKTMYLSADPIDPVYTTKFGGLGHMGIETLDEIPRDVLIGSWHYFPIKEFSFGERVREKGFRQVLLSSNHSTRKIFPHYSRAASNVTNLARYAHRLDAYGLLSTDWNRWGKNTFYELNWPLLGFFAEHAWSASGRGFSEAMPGVIETFYGPGTGPLLETIRFLSSFNRYFGWARRGLEEPDYRLFFQPLVPQRMGPSRLEKLRAFRVGWVRAREAFVAGKAAARLHRPQLDFIEFALDQQKMLADLVEARSALAQAAGPDADDASLTALRDRLERLSREFSALTKRYESLWLRVDMPLGLGPNLDRFMAVQASIDAERARLAAAPSVPSEAPAPPLPSPRGGQAAPSPSPGAAR